MQTQGETTYVRNTTNRRIKTGWDRMLKHKSEYKEVERVYLFHHLLQVCHQIQG